MGIMRYIHALSGKGKRYGKISERDKEIREETAAHHLYSGVLIELKQNLKAKKINRETYEILGRGLTSAYKSFEEGKLPYKGFEAIVEKYTKKGIIFKGIVQQEKKRGGRIEKMHHNLEDTLAAAILFLLVTASLYLPGSITGTSVFEIPDAGFRNGFFFLGSVLAIAISYICFRKS